MNSKWYVGIAVCILLIAISILVIYTQQSWESDEPEVIYEIAPERTGNVEVDTGRSTSPTVTALPQSKESKQVESNVETNVEQTETAMSDESVTVHDDKGDVVEKHGLSTSEGVTNDSDVEISEEELQRQRDTLAELEPEYQRMVAEGEAFMKEAWDDIARELRPKSIAERQSYLARTRSLMEEDEYEPEWADWYFDNLISAMHERGVYFE